MKTKEILALARSTNTSDLIREASNIRDKGHGSLVTYSPKVFIPLTHLCRDVCHYCTFAKTPKKVSSPYMSLKEVIDSAKNAELLGCKEALFTLGERPELRYSTARKALANMGYQSTLEYLKEASNAVIENTELLPHLNPGCMTSQEIEELRPVAASMGMMLESSSKRLCEKGGPHYGSPDKDPEKRLATLDSAGKAKVPFTTGILIGIGETRQERVNSLIDIKKSHDKYGHVQEVIIQNFKPKLNTKMSGHEEPLVEELLWTIAVARIIFGPSMSIQAPPNLSPDNLNLLVDAGINDWGGVSPVTPDYVNPEAPWPHLIDLEKQTYLSGKNLSPRLTIYPSYLNDLSSWVDDKLHSRILKLSDSTGLARDTEWTTGRENPEFKTKPQSIIPLRHSSKLKTIIDLATQNKGLKEEQIVNLFEARGPDFTYLRDAADELRQDIVGDEITFVVNRNINYTNICYFHCTFCAFSKGKTSEGLRGKPYDISLEEITRRSQEAFERGATEVCLQGGIHPSYNGNTYKSIISAIKATQPELHIHAFSPLEIWQGASTLNQDLGEYLLELNQLGLNTLPGTAAEILDDQIRDVICPDKINTSEWLTVMKTAHEIGMKSTATIMFGHVDKPIHWARHLLHILNLQKETGGFTEFVPLPFVPMEAPMYVRGQSRYGPTLRESILMHSVSRLVFNKHIPNIQTSWAKMGIGGIEECLNSGANDLGGTLMNESITRAAGAEHGQEFSVDQIYEFITKLKRIPKQRNTLYGDVSKEARKRSINPLPLTPVKNTLEDRKRDLIVSS
ncbi:MAG: 5-amino-6-(D-ribitylamino)uracil--L-tyrosine 4-hydroxyphenyl transferase CofH [SAR86 cluster bacterium]|nr:5-amino-6-(D-ribitylamino)uracil--L-tyrosine 4-hydroxyphenyl transferase CofH [SAR86 cluster bacterium]